MIPDEQRPRAANEGSIEEKQKIGVYKPSLPHPSPVLPPLPDDATVVRIRAFALIQRTQAELKRIAKIASRAHGPHERVRVKKALLDLSNALGSTRI